MADTSLGRAVSFAFVGVCFYLGIGVGVVIRLGQSQRTNAATTPVESGLLPLTIPEFREPTLKKQIFAGTITIKAVGDIIPGTNFPNYRLPRFQDQLLPKSVRTHLQGSDILFGNFESSLTNHPYTTKDINREQVFAFRSPPAYAQLFAKAGFNVFNMANNHAMDFGLVGFKDTKKNLEAAGIATLGHKNQILYLKANNIPVGMIGFSPYEMYNSIHNLVAAEKLVAQAKKNANIVIVSMHAGAEGTEALHVKNQTEFFYGENRGNSINFARKMIDAGADLVLGHGPHVPRAMEIYKNKIIAYSLGNFLGYRTLSTNAQAGDSLILEVKINSSGNLVSSKIIPIRMDKQGIPQVDRHFRTLKLMRYLNNKAFPKNPVKINNKGEIIIKTKS
ncbi:metallophosphatase [Nostoc linckia z18]|jgi:poly-gamma-glutamate capsule biosynthesis protein CapA/YwtB (metallophosphatase superfamily)|uniref:Metallophosphatase n=2 Tax=Nostoc linckia TaxID=92942 RepID=A0A9Q5ZEZ9_NOSLI|nr:CapA family protein [Nostoc linckia]PHK41850.1 metallophosphatase [Nostoc linckia z15]PHK47674.1 metallophosphatase [Nostoc linckia z16]PHJ59950.1 metallophosphatase [Nostoc linckia z1]PHJ67126.1 metallophosphatase [Nostoc linckia z3]PHJ69856.1 metallophosphatase [Nostoc linckia z2]